MKRGSAIVRFEVLVNVSMSEDPTESRDPSPLTSQNGAANVSAPQCQHCGRSIPARRVAHALRSRQQARWCGASCRVQACVARRLARQVPDGGTDA